MSEAVKVRLWRDSFVNGHRYEEKTVEIDRAKWQGMETTARIDFALDQFPNWGNGSINYEELYA